ncbi:MAG: LLM class flavin-dependent oxidoreductase, partial [Meiothermus silvanus]|nr:LLM class flavin-dependent oxidoreductase [Allomeiothermus silvanus]
MRIFPVIILALVVMSGLALADPPQVPPPSGTAQQQNLLQSFFDLSRWLQSISRDLARLERGISGLALALVLLGFVYGVVQGILGGGLEAIKGAFVRLAVVGLLLSLSTSGFVGNTVEGALTAAREWGTDSVAATLSDAGDSLDALAMRVVPFMGAVGALKMMTAKVAENAAGNALTRSVASGTSAGSAKVLQYLNWTTLLLIPLMLFFFILVVVASFTVEVGVALFPLAAALAVRTEGIRIGVWCELGLSHPVYVAEDASTLDNLSGGRLILAVRRTYDEATWKGYGIPASERDGRFRESLTLLRRAWAPQPFRFEGEHYRVPAGLPENEFTSGQTEISLTPKPAQLTIPLWVSAEDADLAGLAADEGLALLLPADAPMPELEAALRRYRDRRAPGPCDIVALARHVFVARTNAEARDLAGPALRSYY